MFEALSTHPNLLEMSKSLGAGVILQKPVSSNEFLEAVEEAEPSPNPG